MSIVLLKDKKLTGVTVVDNGFIKGFMADAPELPLKAYLYGLMLLSASSADCDIASALGCEEADIRAAFAYWEGAGLVTVVGEEPLQIRYNSVSEAAAGRAKADGARYAGFIKSLQNVLGTRQLSGGELKKVYDWLEVFGMEQDAAVEVVRYCLDKKGVRTSVAYMDSAAKRLAGAGALTKEQVLDAFAAEELTSGGAGKVLKRWHQYRPPTEDELILYEKWTEGWGFDERAVLLACTHMTSAVNPSFGYLDTILQDWHDKGTVSREQIAAMEKEDDIVREIAREAFKRAGVKSAPNNEQRSCVKEWTKDFAMSPELVFLAAELSRHSSRQFVNMRRLIDEWHEKGISGVNAAKAYYEAYQKNAPAQTAGRKKNRAYDIMKGGNYTKEELKKLGISFGEEFYTDDE